MSDREPSSHDGDRSGTKGLRANRDVPDVIPIVGPVPSVTNPTASRVDGGERA